MIQNNFLTTEILSDDLSQETPIIGLSGGINSAGVLCYLASEYPDEYKPKRLLLYYAHLEEHSPDTRNFVAACVRYARSKFQTVKLKTHRTSFLAWCKENNMIPHPTISPCSQKLKIEYMEAWSIQHGATLDLIGYVRKERRRIKRQEKYDPPVKKSYPIAHLSDDDCFALVEREIGWYPAIYSIRSTNGNRLFQHNNCLPCKNMQQSDLDLVERYYPEYYQRAQDTATEIGSYFGRTSYNADPCEICTFS